MQLDDCQCSLLERQTVMIDSLTERLQTDGGCLSLKQQTNQPAMYSEH